MVDVSKLVKKVEGKTPDMSAPVTGGDRKVPVPGKARARLVGYVETGLHTAVIQGVPKDRYDATYIFELSGPKYPVETSEDGKIYPQRISIYPGAGKNYGPPHEKSNAYKVFKILNSDGTAKHAIELLGNAYIVEVFNFLSNKDKSVKASLRGDSGYNITAPYFEDPETGETKKVKVDPAITPTMVFLWNYPDMEQWRSLNYAGSEELSYMQADILKAKNFEGSPAANMLKEAGLDVKALVAAASKSAKKEEKAEEKPAAKVAAEVNLNSVAQSAVAEDEDDDDIPF